MKTISHRNKILAAFVIIFSTASTSAFADRVNSNTCHRNDTSQAMQVICATQDANADRTRLTKVLQNFKQNLTPTQQNAFNELFNAADVYFSARARNEVYKDGQVHQVAWQQQERQSLWDDFTATLENYEQGQYPAFSTKELRRNQTNLEGLYEKLVTMSKQQYQQLGMSGHSQDELKQSQSAWVRYRDAWLKFGLLRYPQVAVASWQGWLDEQRIEQLDDLPAGSY